MKTHMSLGSFDIERSVRNYYPRPIEDWKLNYILEAARLAPSTNNWQPWRIIVANRAGKN